VSLSFCSSKDICHHAHASRFVHDSSALTISTYVLCLQKLHCNLTDESLYEALKLLWQFDWCFSHKFLHAQKSNMHTPKYILVKPWIHLWIYQ